MLHINPKWITNIVTVDGDINGQKGNFAVHDGKSLQPIPQKVDKNTLPDNRGDRSDVWYVVSHLY